MGNDNHEPRKGDRIYAADLDKHWGECNPVRIHEADIVVSDPAFVEKLLRAISERGTVEVFGQLFTVSEVRQYSDRVRWGAKLFEHRP